MLHAPVSRPTRSRRPSPPFTLALIAGALPLCSCASPRELQARRAIAAAEASLATAPARDDHAPARPDLGSYTKLEAWLLTHSPERRAAVGRWRAALERAPAARALPDPTLTLVALPRPIETRVGPQRGRLRLSQSLPWPTKLSAASERALALAAAARWRLVALERALGAKLRIALLDFEGARDRATTTRESLKLLRGCERVARARQARSADRHELTGAQLELAKLESSLASLEAATRGHSTRLNTLLDRAPDAPLGELPAPPSPLDTAGLTFGELARRSPLLRALEAETEARRHALGQALAGRWPDLVFGVELLETGSARAPGVPDDGREALALSLGLSLPIWRGAQSARERAARAELAVAEAELDGARRALEGRLALARIALRDAARRAELYAHGLVAKAKQRHSQLLKRFESEPGGFLRLVEASRELLQLELGAGDARRDQARQEAIIESLISPNKEAAP
jgi:outer membrane protein, heavy metal efflux system